MACLALVGLADAIYLTVQHVTGQSVRCTIVSGCSEVLSSATLPSMEFPRSDRRHRVLHRLQSGDPRGIWLSASGKTTFDPGGSDVSYNTLADLSASFCDWAFCQFCLLSAAVTIVLSVLVVLICRTKGQSTASLPDPGLNCPIAAETNN